MVSLSVYISVNSLPLPLQACVPSYQRRTASTLRISSRPLVSRMAEGSSQTALVATAAQPAPPPIPPPTATEQREEAATARPQTRARRPPRATSGTAWSPTSAMTSKLWAVAWTRREWHPDTVNKGMFAGAEDVNWRPHVKWTVDRNKLEGSDEGGP